MAASVIRWLIDVVMVAADGFRLVVHRVLGHRVDGVGGIGRVLFDAALRLHLPVTGHPAGHLGDLADRVPMKLLSVGPLRAGGP